MAEGIAGHLVMCFKGFRFWREDVREMVRGVKRMLPVEQAPVEAAR